MQWKRVRQPSYPVLWSQLSNQCTQLRALFVISPNFLNSAPCAAGASRSRAVGDVERREQSLVPCRHSRGCAARHPGHHRQHWLGASSAWMPDFSSTHSTTALSGGLWYRPTTSTTFSTNSGSVDSLNCLLVRLEIELPPIRPIVELREPAALRPSRSAPVRRVPRRLFQRRSDNLFHLIQQDRGRPPGPPLVDQPIQPLPDRSLVTQPGRLTVRSQVNDSCAGTPEPPAGPVPR